jgi:hypothetical protein
LDERALGEQNASSMGVTVITLPAITAAQSVVCWPWNVVTGRAL